jgi:ubiquinone/menaquinone biosynthesis C-methylase UbiE
MIPRHLFTRLLTIFYKLLYHQFAWSYDLVAWLVSAGQWRIWVKQALVYVVGSTVLEIGFGPGHLQVDLIAKDIKTVGIDESKDMCSLCFKNIIKYNKDRLNGYTHSIDLCQSLSQSIPFPPNSFLSAISTFPSEYIFSKNTCSELFRVLVPSGRLIVIPTAVVTGGNFFGRIVSLFYFPIIRVSSSLDSLICAPLREAGFEVYTNEIVLPGSRVVVILAEKPIQNATLM